jgi:hypothetical protein
VLGKAMAKFHLKIITLQVYFHDPKPGYKKVDIMIHYSLCDFLSAKAMQRQKGAVYSIEIKRKNLLSAVDTWE